MSVDLEKGAEFPSFFRFCGRVRETWRLCPFVCGVVRTVVDDIVRTTESVDGQVFRWGAE